MRRTAAALALVLALTGACGGGGGGDDPAPAPAGDGAAFPATIDVGGRSVTIERRPERVVSLSPTATEMLFAIGAGDQVVAVDDQSNHPPEAPRTELSGFEPNVEAIAGKKPDLVVLANDTGGVLDGLGALDIPVLLLAAPASLDGSYTQLDALGRATGEVDGAADVVASMRSGIEAVVEQVGDAGRGLRYYHELDPTYFSATSKTFIGDVYSRLGMENIADAADKDGSGYPQLSAEYVVEADPHLVLLADTKCCQQDAATVKARPGWSGIAAVRHGGVVELDDDIASRWGPRVVDLLRTVSAAAQKAAAAKAPTP